ncbi:MAG: hypothetical protein R2809_08370 [Flavobacteriales bacterium]
MKSFILLALLGSLSVTISAQEDLTTIITKDGMEYFVCVKEIDEKNIKFSNDCANSDVTQLIQLIRVFMIIDPHGVRSYYRNGKLVSINDRPLNIVHELKSENADLTVALEKCNEQKRDENDTMELVTSRGQQSPPSSRTSETNLTFIDNSKLVDLVKIGKSDSEIIELIHQTEHKFDTSIESIKSMMTQGVSSDLIRFIMSN